EACNRSHPPGFLFVSRSGAGRFGPAAPLRPVQTVNKVPSGRHVRTVGTHTGKFGAESVRAALRRVRGSAPNFVPRGILGGRNFCRATARRNGSPLKRVAKATR